MAQTTLSLISNRRTSEVTLNGTVATVALDATVSETFVLPSGFGALLIYRCRFSISQLSGAYVAVAPAFDGIQGSVVSTDGAGLFDLLMNERFVVTGTQSARPVLTTFKELFRPALMRQSEQVNISAPIIAGAGVTGTVSCALMGQRIQTA